MQGATSQVEEQPIVVTKMLPEDPQVDDALIGAPRSRYEKTLELRQMVINLGPIGALGAAGLRRASPRSTPRILTVFRWLGGMRWCRTTSGREVHRSRAPPINGPSRAKL